MLAGKTGSGVRVLAEEPYYRHIPRTGLKLSTKISMSVSDRFWMVKMVHLESPNRSRKNGDVSLYSVRRGALSAFSQK